MHGNVLEWVNDRYAAAYPTDNPVVDPSGSISGTSRVYRGGSWSIDGTWLRCAKRIDAWAYRRAHNLGFRISLQKSK